jgi:hypothetical protein
MADGSPAGEALATCSAGAAGAGCSRDGAASGGGLGAGCAFVGDGFFSRRGGATIGSCTAAAFARATADARPGPCAGIQRTAASTPPPMPTTLTSTAAHACRSLGRLRSAIAGPGAHEIGGVICSRSKKLASVSTSGAPASAWAAGSGSGAIPSSARGGLGSTSCGVSAAPVSSACVEFVSGSRFSSGSPRGADSSEPSGAADAGETALAATSAPDTRALASDATWT